MKMFCKQFSGSPVTATAKDEFEKFKRMTEEFTGKQVKTLDVVQEEYLTIFYYKLVEHKPNYEPLTKALDLLVSVDASLEIGSTMNLKMDVERAIRCVKEAML